MSKWIGAIVVAVLVLVFASGLSNIIYRPGVPKVYDAGLNKVDARGYAVGEAAGEGAGTEEAWFDLGTALAEADADPAAGAKVAKKCLACHGFEKGGPNKVGPNLYNIVGHAKASHAGFAYSEALTSLGGSWTYDDLFAFLSKPKTFAPGTKMAFAGIKKPNDVAKLIAYLRSVTDNPPALPAPKPQPAVAEVPAAAPAAVE